LLLKNGGNRVDRFACFELLGEGMIGETIPRFVSVALKSSIEEGLESGLGGGLTHIGNGRNMAKHRGEVCGQVDGGWW